MEFCFVLRFTEFGDSEIWFNMVTTDNSRDNIGHEEIYHWVYLCSYFESFIQSSPNTIVPAHTFGEKDLDVK